MRPAHPALRTCVNLPAMDRASTRRNFLRLMAGIPLLAADAGAAFAAKTATNKTATKTAVIECLIQDARALPNVSQRIDFISGKLLGVPYRANTLIGSPTRPEEFVVRDDAFDCVTFCEVVLAAAIARDLGEFERLLRRIRYDHGKVQYDQRNHYFADWCKRNIENGICQPVAIAPSIVIDKTVTWHREFGRRQVSMVAIARSTLMDSARILAPGDIIGFTSRREGLDYYHTGFIAFDRNRELLLRSASLSHGRVLDEKMAAFVTANPVKYVTLLRAAESTPAVERR
jgi:N-acetylmuramoyl-L-alanine amidase-like